MRVALKEDFKKELTPGVADQPGFLVWECVLSYKCHFNNNPNTPLYKSFHLYYLDNNTHCGPKIEDVLKYLIKSSIKVSIFSLDEYANLHGEYNSISNRIEGNYFYHVSKANELKCMLDFDDMIKLGENKDLFTILTDEELIRLPIISIPTRYIERCCEIIQKHKK